ncbi:hypothetical protein FOCC_FOCC017163 [Frankliniella occidentalis]|uniref:Uncharacterized protein LOC113215326 n=1 Tax=Frankliniella occidentalis TaxID=133901 RepID=A0A6J1TG54_FRAOC|nr:uncharacterized protein LOC113215326 [Frankliniella occidentalis]KAE8737380.1 hypothetical protein FOCC_FOCC017163 [Frankliniella occidentalis]
MLLRTPLAILLLGAVLASVVLGTSPPSSLERSTSNQGTLAAGRDAVLSRKRRYIVFPRGSSIQLVYCMSFPGYIPFQSIFVFGLTAGLAWQLPTEPQQVYLQRRDVGRHPDREHRVNLYRSVQTFLSQRGLRGEECVHRTVCESSSPTQNKGTFMQELLGVLFNLPDGGGEDRTTWDAARYDGTPCAVRFPNCSSVLDLTLPIEAKQ